MPASEMENDTKGNNLNFLYQNFAPKEQLQLWNNTKFYVEEDGATSQTDLKSIKQHLQSIQAFLEIELPEISLAVPSDKFKIIILGDSTKETAAKLLGLPLKRSTTMVSPAIDSRDSDKLFKVWE